MNNLTWIVVADTCKALIYSTHKASLFNHANPDKLIQIEKMMHEQGRLKDTDLVTDRPGTFAAGSFVEETDPKHYEAQRFAHALVKKLEAARITVAFKDIILIMPPAFLGMVIAKLSDDLSRLVSLKIEKNYVNDNKEELIQHLQNFL
jgi:protein required for attachment to host cells